jgi:hypothetical protein
MFDVTERGGLIIPEARRLRAGRSDNDIAVVKLYQGRNIMNNPEGLV